MILSEPNAGGHSERSEALGMEILSKLYHATNIISEMKIKYFCDNWKKCDFITQIKNEKIGVSITRILPPPKQDPDHVHLYIANLLYKKLSGLVISRSGVLDDCVFTKSMLLAWSPNRIISHLLYQTFHFFTDDILKEDVELLIIEADDDLLRNDFKNASDINCIIPIFSSS